MGRWEIFLIGSNLNFCSGRRIFIGSNLFYRKEEIYVVKFKIRNLFSGRRRSMPALWLLCSLESRSLASSPFFSQVSSSLLLQCLIIFPHQFPQAALTRQSLKTGNISLGCRALFTHMENTTIQWGLSTRQVRLRFLFKFGQKIKGCFLIFCSVESLSSFGWFQEQTQSTAARKLASLWCAKI